MKTILKLGLLLGYAGTVSFVTAEVGAEKAWVSYEAESMATTGTILEPGYAAHTIQTESSAQQCVRLVEAGEHLEFSAAGPANAVVVRYNLPDASEGGGVETKLSLIINGLVIGKLDLSSRNMWLYGTYPFSNDPSFGKPRNFYDELQLAGLGIVAGDVIRLEKAEGDDIPIIIDLVDLELVPNAIDAPHNALSILEFGALGDGIADDSKALLDCIEVAQEENRVVWVPEGNYKLTQDVVLHSNITIQGAGMWYTKFVGDADLYDQADRRVRFKLTGSNIHLADFAIFGALNYRNDQEANDGVVGAGCIDSTVSRLWIEHTKAGVWVYNGTRLLIEGCRFRNLLADGMNFCVGTTDSTVTNSSARGTGDDCFAIWPAASDQGFLDDYVIPGNNVISYCTGQLTFLANGASVYGGANNRVENCEFIDIGTGCGILLSTTFPTSDEKLGIDNNFSGTTVVKNNILLRCGGYDHSWGWRGSLQICMDRRSISGLALSDLKISQSFSDGISVVGPGSAKNEGTLSKSYFKEVFVLGVGLGKAESVGLLIRSDAQGELLHSDCELSEIENQSSEFILRLN